MLETPRETIKKNFKHIRTRKPTRDAVRLLDDKEVKELLKKVRVVSDKLNELFASVFTVEDSGQVLLFEFFFSGCLRR